MHQTNTEHNGEPSTAGFFGNVKNIKRGRVMSDKLERTDLLPVNILYGIYYSDM